MPDLKESVGGLRDATVLKALVATWLVDVSHADLEPRRLQLLDVRDVLHEVAGRASDRIAPEAWPDLAAGLGLPDAEAAQRQVRGLGRRITHLSRLTWQPGRRRAGAPAGHPAPGPRAGAGRPRGGRLPRRGGARPGRPTRRGPAAAAPRGGRGGRAASWCWPRRPPPGWAARASRSRSPGAARPATCSPACSPPGRGCCAVWETLDETGALARVLPEWERVRLLPHASVVHRFTVDRHLVETCIEASRLIRRVSRPDVLMAAALLHDLGKGQLGRPLGGGGAPGGGGRRPDGLRRPRGRRWSAGWCAGTCCSPRSSTTRDLEDPATVAYVVERIPDVETLDLLEVLTEADARATSPKAWTAWRAGLVADLARRVRRELDATACRRTGRHAARRRGVRRPCARTRSRLDVRLVDGAGRVHADRGLRGPDRPDRRRRRRARRCMRASVRSARAWTQDDLAISVWDVDDTHLDEAILRQRLDAVVQRPAGPRRPAAAAAGGRARAVGAGPARRVAPGHRDGGPRRRPARAWSTSCARRWPGSTCRCARRTSTTLGPQAVDVFYVQEPGAGVLSDERAASAVHAVRRALQDPVTLDADRG